MTKRPLESEGSGHAYSTMTALGAAHQPLAMDDNREGRVCGIVPIGHRTSPILRNKVLPSKKARSSAIGSMTSTIVSRRSNRIRVSIDSYDYLHVDRELREHTLEMRGDGQVQLINCNGTSSGWHGRWWWENQQATSEIILYVQVDFAGRDSHAKTICFRPFMQRTIDPTFLHGTCEGVPHCVVVWNRIRWEWINAAEETSWMQRI